MRPVKKKKHLSIMGPSHVVRPSSLWSCCEVLKKEVLQREQKRKASKGHPDKGIAGGAMGHSLGEAKPGCWEHFPRDCAWLCCKFLRKPFLKWLNDLKSFAMYFSFHILFALPACPSQPSLTRQTHSGRIQVSGFS